MKVHSGIKIHTPTEPLVHVYQRVVGKLRKKGLAVAMEDLKKKIPGRPIRDPNRQAVPLAVRIAEAEARVKVWERRAKVANHRLEGARIRLESLQIRAEKEAKK